MAEQLYADARTIHDASIRLAELYARRTRTPVLKHATSDARSLGDVVADSYMTGAEEMLKMLMGDFTPEPWSEDYDHEARLTELLAKHAQHQRDTIIGSGDPVKTRLAEEPDARAENNR